MISRTTTLGTTAIIALLSQNLVAQQNPAPSPGALCGVNKCSFVFTQPPILPPQSDLRTTDPVTVNYTAFNSVSYVMKEFIGKHTSVLLTAPDLQAFTVEQAWELVDQADFLYESFTELMGAEPIGEGPLRIAFVDNCGAGCGYVGYKGIELQPYFASGGVWFARGDFPDLYPYMVHEMTHNFDRWSSYVMFGSDIAHTWTSFMDVYVVSANQQGQVRNSNSSRGYAPAEFLKKRVDEFFLPYLNLAGSTWQNCVRNAACSGINAASTQGGFVARLAQLIGPAATQRAMLELRDAALNRGLNPGTMTPEQKNDLLLECFSRGAQTNLGRLVSPLKWTIGSSLQTQLNSLYGTNNYFVNDGDSDGYTPLQGDLNDSSASVYPGAVELVNGIDDDCNGVVDDILFSESGDFPNTPGAAVTVPFPCRIVGSISSGSDDDNFKITLAGSTKVRFTLKSTGSFAGWVFVYDAGGGWLTYSYCGAGAQSELDVVLPAGQWKFSVSQNSSSSPGGYQLTCHAVGADWPRYVYPGKPTQLSPDVWRLVSPTVPPDLVGVSNVQARFWSSGFGWVGTNALGLATVTNFLWITPSNLPPNDASYRVQFFQAGQPASRASEALPLEGGFPFSFTRLANSNRLSWSGVSPGLLPYAATGLIGSWSALTNEVQFTNGQYFILIPRGAENLKVFRLQGN